MINLETLETPLNHHQPLSSARFESHAAYDLWKGTLREGMAIHRYMIARGKYACYTFLLQGMLVWYRHVCLLQCTPGTGTFALYCCSTVVRLVGTCTYVFYACLVQGRVLCMLVW